MPQSTSRITLPGLLVDTAWLEARLGTPGLAIVDIRGYVKTSDLGGGRQHAEYLAARDEYETEHIPGSTYIDWTVDIVDPENPVKVQIAPPDRFAAAMESRGIGDDTPVVAVDHTGGHFATRLWWALTYYGHDAVAVLDGGFNKWVSEDRPLTTEVPRPAPARFTPRARPDRRVEAEQVLAAIGISDSLVVDARDPLQYSGQAIRGSRGGHVPSAVNISAKELVRPDGTWKSPQELGQILSDGGVGDRRVIAYCNGGVTATAVLFALAQTGRMNWANYDGSWNEWGERLDLPVETD